MQTGMKPGTYDLTTVTDAIYIKKNPAVEDAESL